MAKSVPSERELDLLKVMWELGKPRSETSMKQSVPMANVHLPRCRRSFASCARKGW